MGFHCPLFPHLVRIWVTKILKLGQSGEKFALMFFITKCTVLVALHAGGAFRIVKLTNKPSKSPPKLQGTPDKGKDRAVRFWWKVERSSRLSGGRNTGFFLSCSGSVK
ncbi:hypothetical protein ILYODFUR_014726 [Ilyodon furcidens]|uniref:Uncharacterized protein n=1 Tax=Ilyodon furcidens TaxID=33524 RepID=A0ABV0TUY2_9TELE